MKTSQNKVPYNIPMPNNMGMVRYILATAVFIAHYAGHTSTYLPFPITADMGVGGFFALSGFLIYGSYLKKRNPKAFIIARAIRIMPAYLFTVLFFAITFCCISSLGIFNYFTNPGFWKYLLANITFLNFIHPTLPGVFEGLPIPAVNGSLWTMKVEWLLYLSVPMVALIIRKCKNKATLTFIIISILAIVYKICMSYLYLKTGKSIYYTLSVQVFSQFYYFYLGVMIYYWFDLFMKYRWPIMLLSVAILSIPISNIIYESIAIPFALTTLVIGLSMTGKWATWEGKRDNVSYNMYLIHYPIVQCFAQFNLPVIMGNVWAFITCFIIVVILSILMNMIVEKPIQRYLKSLYHNSTQKQ